MPRKDTQMPIRIGRRVVQALIVCVFTAGGAAIAIHNNLLSKPAQPATPVNVVDNSGASQRIMHAERLGGSGQLHEALAELGSIANDPLASKAERCSALVGIATLSLQTGQRDEALNAINRFYSESDGVDVGSNLMIEAGRTKATLDFMQAPHSTFMRGNSQFAGGNDLTALPGTARNLDFASGLAGWEKGDVLSDEPDYIASIDRQAYNGHPAARLESRVSDPTGYGLLVQRFRADKYAGKHVQFSGMLRTAGTPTATWLIVHLDSPGHFTYWRMPLGSVSGGSGWSRCTVVIGVPEDAQDIIFGGHIVGDGTLWMSDMHIDLVGADVPVTPGGITR
jgi:hypothetical protein